MAKIDVYTLKGTKKTTGLSLSQDWSSEVNMRFLAQALRVYEDNSHPGMAKTKTRAEVNRTTKKLYKQKGTGGARHGSKKAPIFVGGGIAHGPRPIRRILSLPEKLRHEALKQALSLKVSEGLLVGVEGLKEAKKTKDISSLLKALGDKRFSLILSSKNSEVNKFVRNIKNADVYDYKNLNVHNVFYGGKLVLDTEIFEKEPAKVTTKPETKPNEVKKVVKKTVKKVTKK